MRDDISVPERSLLVRLLIGGFLLLMTAILVAIAFTWRACRQRSCSAWPPASSCSA